MIHAPRPLRGGRWLFKRVLGRGGGQLAAVSPAASGTPFLSCSNCKLSPLPARHSLTLDVSKIPNALLSSPPQLHMEKKRLAATNGDLSPTPCGGLGMWLGFSLP